MAQTVHASVNEIGVIAALDPTMIVSMMYQWRTMLGVYGGLDTSRGHTKADRKSS